MKLPAGQWRIVLAALVAAVLCGCPSPGRQDAGTDGGDQNDAGFTCSVSFRFRPSVTAGTVSLLGEWDGFEHSRARVMAHDGTGGYSLSLQLPPGVYGYAFLVDGAEHLDPANAAFRTAKGRTWSRLALADCESASLVVRSATVTRSTVGEGQFLAAVEVVAPPSASIRVEGTLRTPQDHVWPGWQPRALTSQELKVSGRSVEVALSSLLDGKYTVKLRVFVDGRLGSDVVMPLWVEPTVFSFRDSPLYMIVTDRFRDGDPSNNPPSMVGVPRSADFQGGDLQGVEQAILEGYFSQLGVRALWLTPWQTNPTASFPDQDGTVRVTGYHGYWPVKAREVDPRLGGAEALHRLVETAHRRGIRVVMDAVLNHVHQEHEYFQDPARRSWFRTGCTCGSPQCGWDEKRLECLFASYMPDINWTESDAADQFIADLVWWVEEFDLDGLRVDAVKHLEETAITSVASSMRSRFETAGTDFYMFGESFTGDYGLINRYMGATGLDGQLDFPLFQAVPERVFATDGEGFQHTKGMIEQSLSQFGGAPMVTFVGNHDVARFITKADSANRDRQGSKWTNLPGLPVGQEPYDRLWLAFLNLMTTPGVPLIYYGDEYGEFGGSDPDNRHPFVRQADLRQEQGAHLARMRTLLGVRQRLRGLQRGPMVTMWANTEDNGKGNLWAYTRLDTDPRQSALVVLNRSPANWADVVVRFPPELRWTSGQVYDALTNREWAITNAQVTLEVPARSGVILSLR